MKKYLKPFGIISAIIIVAVGIIALFSNQKLKNPTPLPQAGNYEYYWGDGCPHCANVQAFFDSWDPPISEAGKKIQIDKKEVWSNPINAALMKERAQYCKIDTNQGMGVPFMFTPEGTCLMGDTPIIDYFRNLSI